MLANEKMRENVTWMWIGEDGMIDIVSDHNMLLVECMVVSKYEEKWKVQKKKWRLKDVNWEGGRDAVSKFRRAVSMKIAVEDR